MNYHITQTCSACPEQYDVYIDSEKVGYLRLRHGIFTVEYKDKLIYTGYPEGDGIFEYDERSTYLEIAKEQIVLIHLFGDKQETTNSIKEELMNNIKNFLIEKVLCVVQNRIK